MSRMVRWAAQLYPRWWRERYGEEFAALLEDARPGMRGALNVLRGAVAMQFAVVSAKRILLFGAAMGLLSGLVVAYTLKPQYASVAVLGIPSTGTNQEAIERIDAVSAQVLGMGPLTRLIKDLNLYPIERQRKSAPDVLAQMRQAIRLTALGKSAFQIQFTYPDPGVAEQVVKALSLEFGKLNVPMLELATRPTFPNKRNFSLVGLAFGTVFGGIAALAVHLGRRRKASA